MNIGDILYFAPGIRFSDVDLDGAKLPDQLRQRISGFYIEPGLACVDRDEAFAAGLLLVSCIDALARLSLDVEKVGERYTAFLRNNIASVHSDDLADRFYKEIRCGLVHEACLKNGAQFSLEVETHIEERNDLLMVNPRALALEVENALDKYVAELEADEAKRALLAGKLKKELEKDFMAAGCAHWLEEGENSEVWEPSGSSLVL